MTTSFLQKNIPVLTDVIPPSTPVVEQAVTKTVDTPPISLPSEKSVALDDVITPQPTVAPTTPYLVKPATMETPIVDQLVSINDVVPTVDIKAEEVVIPEIVNSSVTETPTADWSQWKDEITENVMQAMLAKIDDAIGQTIQTELQQAVSILSAGIGQRIKSNLEEALQATVTQAIEEELQKFKN